MGVKRGVRAQKMDLLMQFRVLIFIDYILNKVLARMCPDGMSEAVRGRNWYIVGVIRVGGVGVGEV